MSITRKARLFQPPRTAMQQGRAKIKLWLLEIEPADALTPEPVMGWVSGADTTRQLALKFTTKEEALAYAEKNHIAVDIVEVGAPKVRKKSYADNFI